MFGVPQRVIPAGECPEDKLMNSNLFHGTWGDLLTQVGSDTIQYDSIGNPTMWGRMGREIDLYRLQTSWEIWQIDDLQISYR